mgnify:CR=1 FL=1|jgi:hypothetical protein
MLKQIVLVTALAGITLLPAACGKVRLGGDGFDGTAGSRPSASAPRKSSLVDLLGNKDDPNTTIEVNKYIWRASLQVLDFMPIQSADPFSGVLVYGYGTPPGSATEYRGTVFVQDPALDARALSVAMNTRNGPADRATIRAIEDAILTRARQLRIADGKL